MMSIDEQTLDKQINEAMLELTPEQKYFVLKYVEQVRHKRQYKPSDLIAMPAEMRERIMAEQFSVAEGESFEIFEA